MNGLKAFHFHSKFFPPKQQITDNNPNNPSDLNNTDNSETAVANNPNNPDSPDSPSIPIQKRLLACVRDHFIRLYNQGNPNNPNNPDR